MYMYYETSTKALISCAIIAQLICAFVFRIRKYRFSHDATHIGDHEKSTATYTIKEAIKVLKLVYMYIRLSKMPTVLLHVYCIDFMEN